MQRSFFEAFASFRLHPSSRLRQGTLRRLLIQEARDGSFVCPGKIECEYFGADWATLKTSCRSRYTDAAKRTRSFKRKATVSVMAGKPPAGTGQPLGVEGKIVTGATKKKQENTTPRKPNFFFPKP